MEIPKTKTVTLSDAERFIEGLKLLATESNATNIEYNGFGPLRFFFLRMEAKLEVFAHS